MVNFFLYLPFVLIFVLIAVYSERKVAAFVQNRLGPTEVGYKGLLQSFADLIKLLQKEDIRASAVDIVPFLCAPVVVFASIFAGFAVLPLNSIHGGAVVSSGLFYMLAIISLDILGILMAGWSSNNKYSFLGAIRSIAQFVSYEIPLGLSVLCVVIITGTLDLQEMSHQQSGIGLFSWNIFNHPVLIVTFVIYFITTLVESNRVPFDLSESESELIGGYHTEYSGFRWGLFMLSEYTMMFLLSIFGVILFFGGWNTPFPSFSIFKFNEWTSNHIIWETFWLFSKTMIWVFVQMWIRWTLPRVRIDQLMTISWKYLTPIILLMVLVCSLWKIWII